MPRSALARAPRARARRRLGTNLAADPHISPETQERAMDSKVFLHCAVLIGAAALVAGCGPDTSERSGAAQAVPATARCRATNRRSRRPAANRDTTVRPPTTATNPAAPGSAAAPPPAAAAAHGARRDPAARGQHRARHRRVPARRGGRQRPDDDPRDADGPRRGPARHARAHGHRLRDARGRT